MDEISEREKYKLSLMNSLTKIAAAQSFENSDAGKLIIEILNNDISSFTKQILSDKFVDNHMQYVDCRAKANYAASLLMRLQTISDNEGESEIRKKLKELEEEDGRSAGPTEG